MNGGEKGALFIVNNVSNDRKKGLRVRQNFVSFFDENSYFYQLNVKYVYNDNFCTKNCNLGREYQENCGAPRGVWRPGVYDQPYTRQESEQVTLKIMTTFCVLMEI